MCSLVYCSGYTTLIGPHDTSVRPQIEKNPKRVVSLHIFSGCTVILYLRKPEFVTQYRTIAIPCVLVWFSRGVGTTSVSFQDDKQLALVSLHPINKSTRRLAGAVRGVTSGVISGLQCKKETLKCFTRLRVKQTHTCCQIVPQEGVAAYKHFKQA